MSSPLSGIPGLDKREDYRARYVVEIEIETGGATHRARTMDISLGGLLLEMDQQTPIDPGAEFRARVPMGEEAPLEVTCVVKKVIPGAGVGAEFVDLRPADRTRLRKLLEKLPH